ncbi:hypothetical protein NLO413_0031 [Candidatus Neoehrlichia lotoris str. RAC413]|uniref:Uncharacterized protein n=1 Tax=Candidatus Neoehrlichia procyonis str. RAC413 TaxID=1359163 RepID=A0A0F3NLM4_9RICK|nr:hypothetical protein NLO413_0031 [Candidatus Neoehrlichia lotoris str. RAC413]
MKFLSYLIDVKRILIIKKKFNINELTVKGLNKFGEFIQVYGAVL